MLLLVNSTCSLVLQCFQGQLVIDAEAVVDVEQFQRVSICMRSIDCVRSKCALSVMWKDINNVCLMAYVDLVEHTHSALEVPLKMTKLSLLLVNHYPKRQTPERVTDLICLISLTNI